MADPFAEFESSNGNNGTNEDPAAAFLAREELEFAKIVNNEEANNDGFGSFENQENQQAKEAGEAGSSAEDPFGIEGAQITDSMKFSNTSELIDANNLLSEASATIAAAAKVSASLDQQQQQEQQQETTAAPATKNHSDMYSAISSADRFSQEPEKIKKWREEQKQRLTQKDAEEELKKKEWKETAKKELEDWYKNRSEQLAKTHANNKVSNKAAEAELVASRDSTTPGQEWERTAKLCDFNPKANKNTKDVSRMRSILLQLKQQPLVR